MTKLAEQRMNTLKIQKIFGATSHVKFISIWITANHIRNQLINKNIRHLIAPHFDQAQGNYYDAALRNASIDCCNNITATHRFFETNMFERRISIRIIEEPVSDIDEAFTGEFCIGLECPS